MTKNGNWLKIASLSAVGGLIVVILTIFSFAGGAVDEKIDNKIIAHEAETELVHQKDVSEIKQDIAVMKEQNKQIVDDIEEIKELIKNGR